MVAQTFPIIGCLLVRRPYLRLLCGMALGTEVIALGIVMGLWNLGWLLFVGFFLDWDRLIFRNKPVSPDVPITPLGPRRLRFAELSHLVLGALLFGLNGHVMFWHLQQVRWTFPLTSYPMFSRVAAESPTNQHLPFYIPVSRFEFDADRTLTACSLHDNWLPNWGMMWIHDTREVNQQIMTRLGAQNDCRFREMKAYRALLRVPPYPKCDPEETIKLLVYHYRDGQFQTVTSLVRTDSDTGRFFIDFQADGFQSPQITVKYMTQDGEGPFKLAGTCSGGRFFYSRPNIPGKVITVFQVQEPGQPAVLFGGPML
jgi:hypothetical protein